MFAKQVLVRNGFRGLAMAIAAFCVASPVRAEELYWWPTAGTEGGTGTWDSSNPGRWSTTTGAKTPSSTVPSDGDDVIFGGTSGTVTYGYIYSSPVPAIDEFIVDTPGYIFKSTAAIQIAKLSINSFGGTGLGSTVFQSDNNATRNWVLDVRSNTAFTGIFRDNDGSNSAKLGLVKLGTGRLDLTSATLNYTNGTIVYDGILRVKSGVGGGGSLPAGSLTLAGNNTTGGYVPTTFAPNGILEVVGNGVGTSYTMGRTSGGSAATSINLGSPNQNAKAGFGAINGNLVVALTSPTAEWSWGGSGFGAATLVLGTEASNGVVTFANPIALNQAVSTVEVVHGSNSNYKIDAEFSGSLRAISATNKLVKTGLGTLLLSGNSTGYNAPLEVQQGALLLGVGKSIVNGNTSSQPIVVQNGGILGGGGTIRLSSALASIAVKSGGTLQAGFGAAAHDPYLNLGTPFQVLTINSNLLLEDGAILAFGIGAQATDSDRLARTGGTWSFLDAEQGVRFTDQGGLVAGTTYTLITGLAGAVDVSLWDVINSGTIDGTFQYNSGSVYFTLTSVPEPSTIFLILGAGVAVVASRRRKRLGKF